MLEKELGKKYPIDEREQFLQNICDGTENVSYARAFTPEEMAKQREVLTDASIMLDDINQAKQDAIAKFKEQAKEYEELRKVAIKNLKMKAEIVDEECYKVIDEETKMVGFYNAEGNLVSSRPAFSNEIQKNLFVELRKTGTENNN